MGDVQDEKTTGCGLFNAMFGKNKLRMRRSSSTSSLPSLNTVAKAEPVKRSKHRRNSSSGGLAFLEDPSSDSKPVGGQKVPQTARNMVVPNAAPNMGRLNQGKKKVNKEALGISRELETMIAETHRAKGGNANLVRASSGNVMLYGHLGNLRQPGSSNSQSNSNGKSDEGQTMQTPNGNARYPNTVMGNIVKTKNLNNSNDGGNPLSRAISCRMDPEELKIMGNEDYKNGRFAEALALYQRAIDIDPNKASYRSNKSAALTALGRLLEAVFECREAIRIEPQYHRAHLRLANLYLKLGEAEKAVYHYKQAGPEADPDVVAKAKVVLGHLKKCDNSKRLRDWNTLLKETGSAISAGADSAPMVFALQAEAFLKLHRHQDADTALSNGPSFDMDQSTKFLGPDGCAALLLIRAQVDMACGRFEDAVAAAQEAARLDPSNKDVNAVTGRARAISSARSHGNDLFKASRFSEACVAYSEGLENDPYNSVLLFNRAACRSRLGQYEKAVEDCTAALNLRPSYTKARLRRADCSSKLGKWEIAVQDYEILMRETPGDEEVGRALFETQVQIKKQRGEDVTGMKFGNNEVIVIQSNDGFRHFTTLPGVAVALFCNKPGDKQTLLFMEQLCKTYPTLKFLKVEVEENAGIASSEGVSSCPAFKIYKNGSRVKEVTGDDLGLLESSIKEYTI